MINSSPNQTLEHWKKVLRIITKKIYMPCQKHNVEWIITGSTASALQNCPLKPENIDILVKNPESVNFISDQLICFEMKEKSFLDSTQWLSSCENRVFIFDNKERNEMWHMGRWIIEDMKVEVAYIQSQTTLDESREEGYIWENGPDMYPYVKKIMFYDFQLNVVPLEIQLSSLFFRGMVARITKIAVHFQQYGYDENLLKLALKTSQKAQFDSILANIRT
ncbi:MAG: hypothetical protein K9W44_06285 [Candidatus Lokiarchaeota archaeon]|nr:hypothetical protein [Candidatus Harpocratesius repetitus]